MRRLDATAALAAAVEDGSMAQEEADSILSRLVAGEHRAGCGVS